MRLTAVQAEDFDTAALLAQLGSIGVGGIASFIGIVRPADDDALAALRLEHHPRLAGPALARLATEAQSRWRLRGVVIIHRTGRLLPGEKIVFAGTASAHRAEALTATAYLIDQLKTRAPFWKAEEYRNGTLRWVEARAADEAAAAAWGETVNLPPG